MSKDTPKSVKLTYFDIRSFRGEKLRLALTLSGTPFEDVRVPLSDWGALRPSTKYGSLPILEIDGIKYHQSGALLRWVGSLGDGSLYPSSPLARMKVDEMIGVADDLVRSWLPSFYAGMKPEKLGYTKETAPIQSLRERFMREEFGIHIGFVESQLAQTGAFVCGVCQCQICTLVP